MSGPNRADLHEVKRRTVRVVYCRMEDIGVGDIVNRDPEAHVGWFAVAHISQLFNGDTQFIDEAESHTVTGKEYDIVGLQLVEEIELDASGSIPPPAPPAIHVAAPVAHPAGTAPAAGAPPTAGPGADLAAAAAAGVDAALPAAAGADAADADPAAGVAAAGAELAAGPVGGEPADAAPATAAAADRGAEALAAAPVPEDPAAPADPLAEVLAAATPPADPDGDAPAADDSAPEIAPPDRAWSELLAQAVQSVAESTEAPVEEPGEVNFQDGSAVDLAKIADALINLDVGSDVHEVTFAVAPQVSESPAPVETAAPEVAVAAEDGPAVHAPRRSSDPESVSWVRRTPDEPRVAMPAGAVPVYGDTLPDSPSYENPVVVPGAAPLPSRRRG